MYLEYSVIPFNVIMLSMVTLQCEHLHVPLERTDLLQFCIRYHGVVFWNAIHKNKIDTDTSASEFAKVVKPVYLIIMQHPLWNVMRWFWPSSCLCMRMCEMNVTLLIPATNTSVTEVTSRLLMCTSYSFLHSNISLKKTTTIECIYRVSYIDHICTQKGRSLLPHI